MINLKEVRRAVGLSQIELGRRANVSRYRISLAESGAILLRSDEAEAIRQVLLPELEKTTRYVIDLVAR